MTQLPRPLKIYLVLRPMINSHETSAPAGNFQSRVWLPKDWRATNMAVALSGGADSVSLLRVLRELRGQQPSAGQLMALHVDHQLRGQDSANDARWCRQQCDDWAIPLTVLTCDTSQFAIRAGTGIEAAARIQRYQLLTAAAEQAGVRYLATAHTRTDQVETVLFRLLRGTGLRGLAGIPRRRTLTPSLTLIRPLLDCSREMVIDYLADLGQNYRTDQSNTDLQFTRNRLRHELLPLLRKEYNQQLDSALVRLANQADDAQHAVERQARRLLDEAKVSTNAPANASTLAICWQAFAGHEPIVASEALRIAWREAGLAEQAMTHQWWSRLAELIQNPCEDKVFNLPGNVRASIAGKHLLLQW